MDRASKIKYTHVPHRSVENKLADRELSEYMTSLTDRIKEGGFLTLVSECMVTTPILESVVPDVGLHTRGVTLTAYFISQAPETPSS
jgi:hypothetical protein